MAMVDYSTVAAGDKFGNIFINRLPQSISDTVDDDPTGAGILNEKDYLMGAPNKTQLLAHYNVGDIVTTIQKVSLVAGGRDILLYTGLMGTVGVLVPFVSSEDVDFFSTLEMHLRTEAPSLVGSYSPLVISTLSDASRAQDEIISRTEERTHPSKQSSTEICATNSLSCRCRSRDRLRRNSIERRLRC